jgi:hypothetical protein
LLVVIRRQLVWNSGNGIGVFATTIHYQLTTIK